MRHTLAGADPMVLGGYVRPDEDLAVLAQQWNTFGFFLGRMLISALSEEAGIFEALAEALRLGQAASLVVLHARESPHSHPVSGPPSVGHTARYVLDHSPAHVLLLREPADKQKVDAHG